MHSDIYHGIHVEVTDFSILLIFNFKQHKIPNIANVLYYGKT